MMPFDITMFQSEQFLIPFLFILAVVFGAVNASNVFRNRGVNLLVSVALAFFAASNASFVNFLWSQFGSISIFFIAMFFIIFTLEAFGIRKGSGSKSNEPLIINGAILFILLSIGMSNIGLIPSLPLIGSGQNVFLLLVILFIIVLFWLTMKIGKFGDMKVQAKE
jgi:hypothetical protein